MPSAQHDREIRIPFLDRFGYLDRFPNHRAGYEGYPEAQRVLYLDKCALFEVGGNGRINQNDLKTSTNQRGCHCEDAKWRGRLRTCERWEEEYDCSLGPHCRRCRTA